MKTKRAAKSNVSFIAAEYLCTGCGTCLAICPQDAIKMKYTQPGSLHATVMHATCTNCSLCVKVCPAVERLEQGMPLHVNDIKGQVVSAYHGHANNDFIRRNGQSGGVTTAILLYLLETGKSDGALVSSYRKDRPREGTGYIAEDYEGIVRAQGSKYIPIAANACLKSCLQSGKKKITAVGLPCHMLGIKRVSELNPKYKENVIYKLGLICDRVLLTTTIDYLTSKTNVKINELSRFYYKSKERKGWPGEVCIENRNGKKVFLPSYERTSIKDIATNPACRNCYDKMNVYCDIVLGDPYGFKKDSVGSSVLIARTKRGDDLIRDACDAGYITTSPVNVEKIFEAQAIGDKIAEWEQYQNAWRGKPINTVNKSGIQTSIIKNLRRNMQLVKQKDSKTVVKLIKRCLMKDRIENKIRSLLKKNFF